MIQGLRTVIDKVSDLDAVKDPFGDALVVIENPHFSTGNVR